MTIEKEPESKVRHGILSNYWIRQLGLSGDEAQAPVVEPVTPKKDDDTLIFVDSSTFQKKTVRAVKRQDGYSLAVPTTPNDESNSKGRRR